VPRARKPRRPCVRPREPFRKIPHGLHDDEVMPRRRTKTIRRLTDPCFSEDNARSLPTHGREGVRIQDRTLGRKESEGILRAVDVVPIKPAVQILIQQDVPRAILTSCQGVAGQAVGILDVVAHA
jgi:hypothetical protein